MYRVIKVNKAKIFLFLFLVSFLPKIASAITVDGIDSDWLASTSTAITTISTNSAVTFLNASVYEWIWKDKAGDQTAAAKPDLIEFRVNSDATNLYLLARFNNLKLGTTDYVTPMLQIAINYADGGIDRFMDAGDVRDEKVSSDAYWNYLLSLYQPIVSTATKITGSDIGWYKVVGASVEKDRKGVFSLYRVASSSTGFFEASIPFADIGGAGFYTSNTVNFTVALFENAASTGGTVGNGTDAGIIDCLSFSSTAEEKADNTVDAYLSVKFDANGKIESNTSPDKVSAASIKIDGKSENNDVIISDRYPVFSWAFTDADTGDVQKAVNIEISQQSAFSVIFSSFVETIEEDDNRVTYPSSAIALQANSTYYFRLKIMDSMGAYSDWSDTVKFLTVSPAVTIDKSKIELKIDWNNPFYGGEITKIRYSIPDGIDKKVFLGIYSQSGRLVNLLVDNKIKEADVIHTEYWDGTDSDGSTVGSGIYLIHLRVADDYKIEKVCFVK